MGINRIEITNVFTNNSYHGSPFKDGNGNMYVVGVDNTTYHPIVIKSTDSGASWGTRYQLETYTASIGMTCVTQVGTTIWFAFKQDQATIRFVPFRTSDNGSPDTFGTEVNYTPTGSLEIEGFILDNGDLIAVWYKNNVNSYARVWLSQYRSSSWSSEFQGDHRTNSDYINCYQQWVISGNNGNFYLMWYEPSSNNYWLRGWNSSRTQIYAANLIGSQTTGGDYCMIGSVERFFIFTANNDGSHFKTQYMDDQGSWNSIWVIPYDANRWYMHYRVDKTDHGFCYVAEEGAGNYAWKGYVNSDFSIDDEATINMTDVPNWGWAGYFGISIDNKIFAGYTSGNVTGSEYSGFFFGEIPDIKVYPATDTFKAKSSIGSIVAPTSVPAGDTTVGGWSKSDGSTTNIYTEIAEETENNATFIWSGPEPNHDIYKVKMADMGPPASGEIVTISYSLCKNILTGTYNVKVRLMEGTTSRKEWTHTNITHAWTDVSNDLTPSEAETVTDWANVYLEFEAY